MKTSIIIPCYFKDNSFVQMTDECIASLIEFGTPDEVIVVDDGSPIHVEFANCECILREKNGGFPAAVNTGLENATGDILIISNNDIVFTPDWLEELLKPLKEGFDISSIVTSDQGWETKDLISQDDRFGSLWAMKRKVYDTIGGMDERFGTGTFEDADYYLRARQAGFIIGKNWNGLVEHRGRATFDAVDPKHNIFIKNRELFREKWGYII